MILSKKQNQLINDIKGTDEQELYILGSTQSGKTFSIALGTILYAQNLSKDYPEESFDGAIVGWSVATMKKNILDVIIDFFKMQGTPLIKHKDYKWGNNEKWVKIKNITFTFFPFNNILSFNNIVGRPLIYVWIDESARIYTQTNLRENFNQFPGRQMSYANNPYIKTIHSFNVEGGESHPYKKDYLEVKKKKHYIFYPYDNPKINTKEAMQKVIELFPPGSLREQKVYNKWIVAEGRVFNDITKIDSLEDYNIREIGIGCDYGSVNPTTFCSIALAHNQKTREWNLILLDKYYHDPKTEGDTPTTEYYSNQLKEFISYLQKKYPHIPVNTLVIDSEASHFSNRLDVDGIRHELAKKNNMSVDKSVQLMQSLFYKELLLIKEMPNIRYFINGEAVYGKHDIGLDELESYRYDKVKSERDGINCYVKDFDHYVDGSRYIIMEYSLTGRAPIV